MGDNGTDRDVVSRVGDRLIRGDKGHPTEAGTHVPMIAHWPGAIAPGQVNDNLIDFTDFLPTLMEAARLDVPEEGVSDGLSFYRQLVGTADTTRAWSSATMRRVGEDSPPGDSCTIRIGNYTEMARSITWRPTPRNSTPSRMKP